MKYYDYAKLWASYNNEDLKNFFKSDFFKKYVSDYCENHEVTQDQLPYEIRLKLSDDMEKLGLIPFTALEDAYDEETELAELLKFKKLYQQK